MGDGIILNTGINLSGFTKGSKQLMNAITSMSNKVSQLSKRTQSMAKQAASPLKRMIPLILGVGSAYGVISKAVSAFMSQNQQLSAQMSSIWTALGNVLGPIITQIINWVSTAVSYFLSFLKLLGVTSKSASELSKSASGAAKEMQKTLAGFDELNVLNDNSGGGGGSGADATLKDIEPSEWMKKLSELLKNKMWDEAADMIIDKFNELIHIFATKAEEFGHKAGEYLAGAVTIIGRTLNEVNWHELGEGIANFFNGVLEEINKNHSGEHIGEILVAGITIAIKTVTGFLENLNPYELATTFSDIVKGALQALIDAIEGANWELIGNNIKTFLDTVDWEGIGDKIGDLLETAWNAAWDTLLGVMGKGTDDELPIVEKFEGLKTAIEEFARVAGPILKDLWENVIQPLMSSALATFIDGLTTAIEGVTKALETMYNLITGRVSLADYIRGEVKGTEVLVDADKNLSNTVGWLGKLREALNGGSGNVSGLANEYQEFGIEVGKAGDEVASATEKIEEAETKLQHSKTTHQEAKQAVEEFNESVDRSGEVVGKTAESAEELSEKIGNLEVTAEAIEKIGDSAESTQQKVDEASEKLSESADEWTQLKDKISESMEGIKTSVEENFDASQTKVEEVTKAIQDNVSQTFDDVKSKVEETMNEVTSIIQQAWDEANSTTQSALSEISSIVDSELSYVASSAYTWGADMGYSFADGIYASAGAVYAACYYIASIAQSILGFSEPDIGPLSDFHKSGPDMMKLFASGIESESGTVAKAVNDVAQVVSDSFGGMDLAMPDVASGNFLPYGIGSGSQTGVVGGTDFFESLKSAVAGALVEARNNEGMEERNPSVAILNINGREFYRATFYDQQTVAKEHGISLVTK